MRLNFGPLTDATTRNWGMPGLGGTMLAAGQILPMMQKRREDQTKGRFQELLTALDQTKVMPQTPDEPLVDPKHAGILMIGELLSRLSGGEGVVNPYMQGRGMMLGQLSRQREQEEQVRAQNAAIGLQKAQLLLSEAQREQEGFESRVNRAQTLEFGRQKQKFEQEKEANEFAFKMAQYGDSRANTLNDNLQARANGFNNGIDTRWREGGQFSPKELDELNAQRAELIRNGVPDYILRVIPEGPTLAKQKEDKDNEQWQIKFDADQKQLAESNRQADERIALSWAEHKRKIDGEKMPLTQAKKEKGKWVSETDKKINKAKEDYAVAVGMLASAPDDQYEKARQNVDEIVLRYRYLLKEKHRAVGALNKQPQFYQTVLPDGSMEDPTGLVGAAGAAQQSFSGAISGNRPVTPSRTGNVQRAPQRPTPKRSNNSNGSFRQVSQDTYYYKP